MKRLTSLAILILSGTTLCGQGVVFDDDIYNSSPIKARLIRGDYEVPLTASLKQYSPQLGNQLSYSSSVAWAIAWQARTLLYNKHHNITGKEEKNEHIFGPAYLYKKAQTDSDENCGEGITLEAGLKAAKEYGMPFFNDYIYFCGGPDDKAIAEKAKQHVISDYSKVFELNDTDENKIQLVKKTISEGWPVVIGMLTPPSFKRAREFWQPQEQPNALLPGQALCVVGYDNNKFGGAFEVANSWGGNWGNNGFMWIRYEDFTDFVKYAYEVFVAPIEKPYQLKGSVKFQLATKKSMPVKFVEGGRYIMRQTYGSGTQFQVFVTNEDPAFVYVFGSDLTNECFQIFPHKKTVSAALTYKGSHIAIPDEQHFIEFDETPGTDFLCVLYSREELDIENIINKIESYEGEFHEKVKKSFNEQLLNKNVKWSESEVAFEASAENGSVVAAVVEINHD